MSNQITNAVLDHLCESEPLWAGALQVLQLARQQCNKDDVQASAQLVCALVLMASASPNPQEFLKHTAETLMTSPFAKECP